MSWLSKELGFNHAYIQQFIERGSPRELDDKVLTKIARLLDLSPHMLGLNSAPITSHSFTTGEFAEEAEAYNPGPGSLLTTAEAVGYFRILTNVLERHPLGIAPGDILAFDLSAAAVESVKTEKIVVLQLYDKSELLAAKTVIREFVRPDLVMTNRRQNNEVFSLSDPTLPFEPVIKGVFRSLSRG